jgi:hypothetical protein
MSVSGDPGIVNRQWSTVRRVLGDKTEGIENCIEVATPWDAEQAYRLLEFWHHEKDGGLTFAPFGVKPHTLAMTLFAIRHECSLVYTQPKSYNPKYTKGQGSTRAYVIKWNGVVCYGRLSPSNLL